MKFSNPWDKPSSPPNQPEPEPTPEPVAEQKTENAMVQWAKAYTAHPLNWRLCKIRPNSKAPMLNEWNKSHIGPEQIESAWGNSPNHGIGLVHTHTGAWDIDSVEYTRIILSEFGIDFDAILSGYPRIKGRDGRDKIVFNLPPEMRDLKQHKLLWPDRENPSKTVTVFELRAGTVQDVLPPSIHPDTMKPYEWIVSPFDFPDGIPDAPKEILAIWKDWPSFQKQFLECCPWSTPPEIPRPAVRQVSGKNANIIGQFNNMVVLRDLLEAHGYRKKGKRWISPSSSSGMPGVVIFKDSGKCYSHHASDPLNDGHAHDAFDVFCVLSFNGDFNAALSEAKRRLGIVDQPSPEVSDFINKVKQQNNPDVKLNEKTPEYDIKPVLRDRPDFPIAELNDVADWIQSYAYAAYPVMAQHGTLALAAQAAARLYTTPQGDPCSLYLCASARSASELRYVHQAIFQALSDAGMRKVVRSVRFTGQSGIYKALFKAPALIYLADDYGSINAFAKRQPSGAQEHALSILSQIYDGMPVLCDTGEDLGIRPADQATRNLDEQTIIQNPSLTILGLMGWDHLTTLLKSSELGRGATEQMLFALGHADHCEAQEPIKKPTPEWLNQKIRNIRGVPDAGELDLDTIFNAQANLKPNQKIVSFSAPLAPCYALIDKLSEDPRTRPLLLSARAILRRIAACLSVWKHPHNPVADQAIVDWSTRYVLARTSELLEQFALLHGEDSKMSAYDYVQQRVEEAGVNGILHSDLVMRCKPYRNLDEDARNKLMKQMLGDEVIFEVETANKKGGPKGRRFYAARYVKRVS